MVKWYERGLLNVIKAGGVPSHIAFIMDGNRRWATKRGLKKTEGHSYGLEKLYQVLDWCLLLEIPVVSVFAFSTDNFKRSEEEVQCLMELFLEAGESLRAKSKSSDRGVRVKVAGNISEFPQEQQEILRKLEESTRDNRDCTLNLCLGYGSIEEIISSFEKLQGQDFTVEAFEQGLDIPQHVDLLVRTGEKRLSNFLLYQCNFNTKFVMYDDVFWPSLSIWNMLSLIFKYQHFL